MNSARRRHPKPLATFLEAIGVAARVLGMGGCRPQSHQCPIHLPQPRMCVREGLSCEAACRNLTWADRPFLQSLAWSVLLYCLANDGD